ncbi:MAG TPA: hypothetical protein VLA72_22775, partial [Anaerolineales bacterium]|nr:hypothetical protein [Anaerolineales bacterium]
MTKLRSILVVLTLTIVLLSACGGSSSPLVLKNGLIFTATGSDPIPNGVIVIEKGLITAVGAEADVTIPNGATVIDVEGRTILPGLIDAHTHILNNLRFENGEVDDISIDDELSGQFEVGVTTLQDLGTRWSTTEELSAIRTAL